LQDAKTGRQGERLDRRVPGYVHIGQWYAVKLSVRGDRATCKLDGIDVFHDAPIENPTGGVGLRTSRTAARFRNLMVTDPAGRVLFREVPDPKRCQGFRTLVPIGLDHEVRWRYTTDEPGTDWRSPEFDDSAWKEGLSAFAKHSVQTGVARTIWRQPDIWIRHTFETTSEAPALELLLRHDDDIDVYIDGRLAFRETGAIQEYKRVPVLRAARESLKAGTHVIAVHCHDYGGLAFVDVGVQESLTSNP
jgi:hypothetical protein